MPTNLEEWAGFAVGIGILLGYLSLHVFAGLYLRRGWGIASVLPLPVFAFVLYLTIEGLRRDSNLWPIFMIFYLPPAVLYLIVLIVTDVLSRKKGFPEARPDPTPAPPAP